MTATTVPLARVGDKPEPTSAIFALARFEGRMMLRHPLVWVGGLGAAGWAVRALWEEAPVLNRVSVTLAWTVLPFGFAVAMVAGWAVLRAKGRSDANPPMVMPIGMAQRVSGIVLGLVYPAAAAFVIQMLVLGWVMTRNPVTSVVWTEVLAAPVYVMFAGAVGAALTRWIPHPSTALFAVVVLGGLMIAFPYRPQDWGNNIGVEWLSPLAWPQDIIPYELAFRPSGLHLGYLVGLSLLVAGIAILGRWPVGWTALGIGLVLAFAIGTAQLGLIEPSTREQAISRLVGDTADLTCETHDSIDFCAMPGYEGWIEKWADSVQPVVSVAPTEVLNKIEVRQYPVHNTFLFGAGVLGEGNWWWVKPAAEDYFAREVVAVGSILAQWTNTDPIRGVSIAAMGCGKIADDCRGASQQVVLVWLLAHDPRTAEYLSYDAEHSGSAFVSTCMVTDFWANPAGVSIIRDNWDRLTDPATTYEEAGEIMGVSVPGGYDDDGILETACP